MVGSPQVPAESHAASGLPNHLLPTDATMRQFGSTFSLPLDHRVAVEPASRLTQTSHLDSVEGVALN